MTADADAAVRAWYADPVHFHPSSLCDKLVDWRLLFEHAPFDDKNVLNTGCDFPVDEYAFARYSKSWIGVDFTSEVVERCRQVPGLPQQVSFVLADFRELPFPDGHFDIALDFSASDHVQTGTDKMRREAFRVLRSGGVYIVTYANANVYGPGGFGDFGYVHPFTPEEIRKELEAAGFTVTHEDPSGVRSGIVAKKG